jgi:hypothetical protein
LDATAKPVSGMNAIKGATELWQSKVTPALMQPKKPGGKLVKLRFNLPVLGEAAPRTCRTGLSGLFSARVLKAACHKWISAL